MARPLNDAEIVEILALAHALIDAGWCQRAFATTARDWVTGIDNPRARNYCLAGALAMATLHVRPDCCEEMHHIPPQIDRLVQSHLPPGQSEAFFNDTFGRTREGVLAVLERAAGEVGK